MVLIVLATVFAMKISGTGRCYHPKPTRVYVLNPEMERQMEHFAQRKWHLLHVHDCGFEAPFVVIIEGPAGLYMAQFCGLQISSRTI